MSAWRIPLAMLASGLIPAETGCSSGRCFGRASNPIDLVLGLP